MLTFWGQCALLTKDTDCLVSTTAPSIKILSTKSPDTLSLGSKGNAHLPQLEILSSSKHGKKDSLLDTRIILRNVKRLRIEVIPRFARRLQRIHIHQRSNFALPLNELDSQPLGNVPADVAVHLHHKLAQI
jgi:hypothetical protein